MKLTYIAVLSLIVSLLSPLQLMGAETIEYDVKGLQADAEIRIDHWGVPHIYAQKHYDAFFVQGFNAARLNRIERETERDTLWRLYPHIRTPRSSAYWTTSIHTWRHRRP